MEVDIYDVYDDGFLILLSCVKNTVHTVISLVHLLQQNCFDFKNFKYSVSGVAVQ